VDSSAFVADPKLLEALELRATQFVCEEDRELFRQGETPSGLYIFHKGDAFLTMKSEKGEVVLCIQPTEGSLLGLPALVGNEPYSLTAKVTKGSELGFVTGEDFNGLMQTDATVPFRVLNVLAAEVRAARQALLS
ncbi:MAG: cyclic nucleotide-binding domain-containing protein, partial [Tepidisphaeraceae bacterium]